MATSQKKLDHPMEVSTAACSVQGCRDVLQQWPSLVTDFRVKCKKSQGNKFPQQSSLTDGI